ncbi:hypothetical protein B0T18DRAFT_223373 [Schizothecium vesticola]|uniref:Uncharacterized protein n=1 Tax=Schizothecium vesticola TaxID=314040 RepID=A0AA40EKI9_9PEZI|nr:hypothetical protein B0T18DRAFT_223373 [Schizothecium vesticola]
MNLADWSLVGVRYRPSHSLVSEVPMVIRPTNDQHKRPAAGNPPTARPAACRDWQSKNGGQSGRQTCPPTNAGTTRSIWVEATGGTSCTTPRPPSPAFRDLPAQAERLPLDAGGIDGSSGWGRLIYTAGWPWT